MNSSNARKHSDSRLETRPSRTKNINATSNATDSLLGTHNCSTSATRKRKIDSCDSSAAVSSLDADSSGGDGSGSTTSIHQSSQAKFSKHDEITSLPLMPPADEYLLLNYIMTHDEDYSQAHTTSAHPSHTRTFCEGLGDQGNACIHRFEVFISETNVLSQCNHPIKSSISSLHIESKNKSAYPHKCAHPVQSGTKIGTSSFLKTGYKFYKSQKSSVKKFTFDCELGDKWVDSSLGRSCKLFKTVNKNSAGINQVIEKLSSYGVRLTSVLSSGKFSHVFAGNLFSIRHRVAVKIYDKKSRSKSDHQELSHSQKCSNHSKMEVLPEEISIHRLLHHKNITELMHVETVEHHLITVMELCDHSNLQGIVQVCPGSVLAESVCRKYFQDMVAAVYYLHAQNVVHRDIRCDNFLVDAHDRIKLCDLSRATHYSNGDTLQTVSYTQPPYSSPEIMEKKPHNPKTSDIWALGVCLHFLLTSKLPFITVHDSYTDLTIPPILKNYPILPKGSTSGNTNPAHISITPSSSADAPNASTSNNAVLNANPSNTSNPIATTPAFLKREVTGRLSTSFQLKIDPLTLMKKGVDIKVIAPSVFLSSEAVELLKGVLHYVLKVRFSLNRVRSSGWMKKNDENDPNSNKPHIGNHYKVSNLQKCVSGEIERRYKAAFEI